MNTTTFSASLLALSLALAAPAMAQTTVSGSVTAATDYMWRGVSQTDNNPAVFAAVSVNAGKFYAGAGAENVDFSGINTEYDLWAGYVFDLGNKNSLDLGLVRYGYIDAPSNIDTLEVKAALSHAFDKGNIGVAVYYTDNYFGSDNAATYTEINAGHSLTDKLSLNGAVAYQQLSNSDADYATWNLGLTYAATPHLSLDLRYHDNDMDNAAKIADSKIVASIKAAF